MAIDKLECGRSSVDKYLDIKYGDEDFFAYIGAEESYRSIFNLIEQDEREDFRRWFAELGTDMKGRLVKIKRYDGVYRNAYIEIKKKDRLVSGQQLWDMNLYDIEGLKEGYHKNQDTLKLYRRMLSLSENILFDYNHENDEIRFFRMRNSHENVLISMELSVWKEEAVILQHISAKDTDVFRQFCSDLEEGIDRVCCFGTSFFSNKDAVRNCRFEYSTIMKNAKPYLAVGMVTLNEVTEEIHEETAEFVYSLDPLTSLLNKRAISNVAQRRIDMQNKEKTALFILDIDDFKSINDNFGHMYGDEVIARVAEVIADTVGEKGSVGRIGGDEFMGIIENVPDRDSLRNILRAIRGKIEYLYEDTQGIQVTCSIGAARCPDDYDNYDDLFNCADKCLYLAKDKGKNRYIIYEPELHGKLDDSAGRINLKAMKAEHSNNRVLGELISNYFKEGTKAFGKSLESLMDIFGFDRISLYYGEDFKKLISRENIESMNPSAFFAHNEEYMKNFDEDGICVMDTLYRLEEISKEIYDQYKEQHTEAFIQTIIGEKEQPQGFISFECCSPNKKFTEYTKNSITVIARLMGEVVMMNHGAVKEEESEI